MDSDSADSSKRILDSAEKLSRRTCQVKETKAGQDCQGGISCVHFCGERQLHLVMTERW